MNPALDCEQNTSNASFKGLRGTENIQQPGLQDDSSRVTNLSTPLPWLFPQCPWLPSTFFLSTRKTWLGFSSSFSLRLQVKKKKVRKLSQVTEEQQLRLNGTVSSGSTAPPSGLFSLWGNDCRLWNLPVLEPHWWSLVWRAERALPQLGPRFLGFRKTWWFW